jgi:hypothetical protein
MKCFEKDLKRSAITQEEKSDQEFTQRQKMEEPDLLPEFCHYKDEGCELAESCLECPFPVCIYDQRRDRFKSGINQRNKEMRRCYSEEKMSLPDLVKRFGVSLRTVQRTLAAIRNKRRDKYILTKHRSPARKKERRSTHERHKHCQPDSRKRQGKDAGL